MRFLMEWWGSKPRPARRAVEPVLDPCEALARAVVEAEEAQRQAKDAEMVRRGEQLVRAVNKLLGTALTTADLHGDLLPVGGRYFMQGDNAPPAYVHLAHRCRWSGEWAPGSEITNRAELREALTEREGHCWGCDMSNVMRRLFYRRRGPFRVCRIGYQDTLAAVAGFSLAVGAAVFIFGLVGFMLFSLPIWLFWPWFGLCTAPGVVILLGYVGYFTPKWR